MVTELLLAEAATDDAGALAPAALFALAVLYFVPTVIGMIRKVRNLGSVIVVNVFLGWTCLGWIIALAMSMRTVDRAG